tara:strand:- start:237 stop:674 length:438 start_codon:yes stop_codon:yes gene_type:complete
MEQPEYNLFNRTNVEVQLKPIIEKYGLGTTIWSPLCSGMLTGKYQSGVPKGSRFDLPGYEWLKARYESDVGQTRIQKVEQLKGIIKDMNCTLAQAAIAWCAKNPQVSTVILGATSLTQLQENIESLQLLETWNDSDMNNINSVFS